MTCIDESPTSVFLLTYPPLDPLDVCFGSGRPPGKTMTRVRECPINLAPRPSLPRSTRVDLSLSMSLLISCHVNESRISIHIVVRIVVSRSVHHHHHQWYRYCPPYLVAHPTCCACLPVPCVVYAELAVTRPRSPPLGPSLYPRVTSTTSTSGLVSIYSLAPGPTLHSVHLVTPNRPLAE